MDLPLSGRDGGGPCLKRGHRGRFRTRRSNGRGHINLRNGTRAGRAGRLVDAVPVIGDRGHLELRRVPRVGHQDELTVPAEVHALQLVKEHLPFVITGARFSVSHSPRNVLDGLYVLDAVAGHIEFGGHLVVLGVAGHFTAIEVVGAEVVLVKGRVRTEVSGAGGSYAECGEIEDVSA